MSYQRFTLVVPLCAVCPAFGQTGLAELAARLGEVNVPTGDGVVVGHIEVPDANGNYRANPGHAEFAGKTFTLMSGASNNSSHATMVGRHFYGLDTSIAPGITSIFSYNVTGWLGAEYLRTGSGATVYPLLPPAGLKLFNNSWVAHVSSATNNEVLRRADFVVLRDDVIVVNGVNFEDPQVPLMTNMYNGISVGRSNGMHATSDTSADHDGPGRMKPELVAQAGNTSNATALVSGAAALLIETARTTPPLDKNPLAQRSEVIKAALLGGASRSAQWTNNPSTHGEARGLTDRPLDDVLGAGQLDVNNAHLILTGDQRPAQTEQPVAPHICHTGWDLPAVGPSQSRYWRFTLPQMSLSASVVATWHRSVGPGNLADWSAANFDLRLWRVDESENLAPLIGASGEAYFTSGNVASHSAVDNVELLYVHHLVPGDYVIELQRMDQSGAPVHVAVAWLMDQATMSGDLTGNGSVDGFDLLQLLGAWGLCPGSVAGCPGDVNCDGVVDGFDLLVVLGQWTGTSR